MKKDDFDVYIQEIIDLGEEKEDLENPPNEEVNQDDEEENQDDDDDPLSWLCARFSDSD